MLFGNESHFQRISDIVDPHSRIYVHNDRIVSLVHDDSKDNLEELLISVDRQPYTFRIVVVPGSPRLAREEMHNLRDGKARDGIVDIVGVHIKNTPANIRDIAALAYFTIPQAGEISQHLIVPFVENLRIVYSYLQP